MPEQPTAPPAWLERTLARVVPPGRVGAEIRGDLRQEYVALRLRTNALVAGTWYATETLKVAVHAGWEGAVKDFVRGDLRHAVRGLLRAPTFTVVAVLTLALGLGANSALFAVLRAVVLSPLPFERPEEVVALRIANLRGGTAADAFSFPLFEDFGREQSVYSGIAGFRRLQPALTDEEGQPPRRVTAVAATHDLLPLLGVEPRLGRGITPEEDVIGGPPVVLVSHSFWVASLGADPGVLSRSLVLDGTRYRIVGVLPETFSGETLARGFLPDADAQVWMGYRNSPASEGITFRGLSNVSVVARLGPGVTLEMARSDGRRIMADLRATYSEHATDDIRVVPAHDVVVGPVSSTLFLLFGAVVLVLLIACTNVASLVLGRTRGRAREIALRAALGAGQGRLVRLLVAEAVLLAFGGAVAGGFVATAVIRVVLALDPGSIPRLRGSALDGGTMLFLALGATVVVAILGVAPLLYTRPPTLGPALRESSRSTDGGVRARFRKALVVVQVAGATVLLLGAGVFARSLGAALRVEPGFEPEGVLTARVVIPDPYVSRHWPEHVLFFRELMARLGQTPGVVAAGAGLWDPADQGWNNAFTFVGRPEPEPGSHPSAGFRPVTPGYFTTAGIPLVSGRDFDMADDTEGPGVAIANEAFVRRYFDHEEAVGAVLRYGDFWNAREDPDYRIVGVVADHRTNGLTEDATPTLYFPHAQQPVREMAIMLRAEGHPLGLAEELRKTVESLDPRLPVDGITTLDAKLGQELAGRRFITTLLGLFAAVALALATVGLYGVLSFLVAHRTHEIGVRMALGAERNRVVWQVLREGIELVALGLALGLPTALLLGQTAQRLLFEVTPSDPVTATVVPSMLLVVGAATCLIPARRATRVDPLRALATD